MEPSSSSCTEKGKLFVGGIPWKASQETLMDHFKKYGEVLEAVIVKDRDTGNVRGFGFVQFSDPDSADRALKETNKHVILGRKVEVKEAIRRYQPQLHQQHPNQSQLQNTGLSRSSTNSNNRNHPRTKKIFVGGLSSSLTKDEFTSYFEKFGRVNDVVVMYDRETLRPRGFGFITFDTEEAVDNVMQNSFHELNGKVVEVKRAVPKDGNSNCNDNNYNGNTYSSRMVGRGGPFFGNYDVGINPSYGPWYGCFPGYMPPHGYAAYAYEAGVYGGGYIIGGNEGIDYGTPFASPRSPWNGPGLVTARHSPLPYYYTPSYPGYFNSNFGSYMGMAGGGYYGIMRSGNDKWNRNSTDAHTPAVGDTTPSQVEGGKFDTR